jgi:hypothetical protein
VAVNPKPKGNDKPDPIQYVNINDQKYALRGGVEHTIIRPLSDAFRTQGIQQRSDDASVNRYPRSGFPLGIGFQTQNRETGRGVGGYLDATCEMGNSAISMGFLQETQTHANPAEHLKKAVNFKGDFWGVLEEDYVGNEVTNLLCRKFGATSDDWTGGGTMTTPPNNTLGARGFDMVAHKTSLFAIGSGDMGASGYGTGEEVIYSIASSADGAAWASASLIGFPDDSATNRYVTTTTARQNNFDDDEARLLSFGNTLLASIYRDPDATDGDGLIEILSTTDSGANWASDVTIPSGSGPKAFVSWLDLDANRSPVLVTAEVVYSIDITNNVFELIYELDGDPNNGRWAVVGNDGALYLGLGSGDIIRLNITGAGDIDVIRVGPAGDGLVAARQGHANYFLRTPSKWLLVAYGGHAANKNASIFKIDTNTILTDPITGERFMPMHPMYQHATADLDIVAMGYSTEDDATPRLHFAVEGASADVLLHIEEPFANPLISTTVKYQSSSFLREPDDDLGDPQTNSLILQALVQAVGLTADTTGEYIQLQDGLNGAVDTTNTRGRLTSGVVRLPYGTNAAITAFASGAVTTVTSNGHGLTNGDIVSISGTTTYNGSHTISVVTTNTFDIDVTFVGDDATGRWVLPIGATGKSQGRKWTFNRGSTATNSPKAKEFEVQAQNLLLDKERFSFTIDLDESPTPSGKGSNVVSQEQKITNLKAVLATTLVLFEYGRSGRLRVRVPNDTPPVWHETLRDSSMSSSGYRTGTVTITVEEGI